MCIAVYTSNLKSGPRTVYVYVTQYRPESRTEFGPPQEIPRAVLGFPQGHRTHTALWQHSFASGFWDAPLAKLATWSKGDLLLYIINRYTHRTRVASTSRPPPDRAINTAIITSLYIAIQRYTLYSYTSLYAIQPLGAVFKGCYFRLGNP